MNFAHPNWAWCLFLLPVIALLKIAADARARRVTAIFASSERLRQSLQGGTSLIRSGVRFGLQVLGLGFFILALTQPQVGNEERTIDQVGRNVLIAIDCSKSMLATDVSPDRLTRAKLAAQDLIEKLPGDRVGLIAFAGRAFLQAPLTTDHEAVVESIQALDHTTIPRGGSSLGAAIALAAHAVEGMPGRQHGLIIFSDGGETDNTMLRTAKDAHTKGLLILPVGVGTTAGEVVPDPDPQRQGEYLRDENGNVLKTRLEGSALRELSEVSGGEYIELNSQALSQTLVNRLLSNLDEHRAESRQLFRPIDRYQWPLFAGILCLVMSLIVRPASPIQARTAALPVNPQSTVRVPPPLPSGGAAAGLIILLALGVGVPSSHAATRKELSGARLQYDEGHYDRARDSYKNLAKQKSPELQDEVAYGLGASSLKMQDFESADRAFSDALKSPNPDLRRRAQRGLATALYEKGDMIVARQPDRTIKIWTDSRDHFEDAMRATTQGTPEYNELKENRDFVQQRLDELKRQQEQQQQQQQQQQQDQQGKGDGNKEQQQKQPSDGQQQPPKEGDGKKTDALQKNQEVPEGELRAGEAGKPDANATPSEGGQDDNKRNDKTGFSPQEARSQLRNYADDQKSVQYLMRDEDPPKGKDY